MANGYSDDEKQTMDFARFLSTGELSDTTVTVDSKVFKLHKFPLYTKSDFFRTLARSTLAEKDDVTLTDFPGGPACFELVASYCYNVRIQIAPENVCQLRCAAEFLQMISRGNLAGATDRVLDRILSSTSLERRLDTVVDLVLQCRHLGAIAEQAGIIAKCTKAIVDGWLSTPTFTRNYSANQSNADKETLRKLTSFPLNWFADLLRVARDEFVSASVCATLIEMYITNALDLGEAQDRKYDEDRGHGPGHGPRGSLGKKPQAIADEIQQEDKGKREAQRAKENVETEEQEEDHAEEVEEDEEEKEEEEEQEEEEQEEEEDKETENEEKITSHEIVEGGGQTIEETSSPIESTKDHNDEEEEEEETEDNEEQYPGTGSIGDEEISAVLDTLLCEFPEAVSALSGLVTPKWVVAVLAKARAFDLRCKGVLVQMIARLLDRFSDEDLAQLAPDIFVLVLEETCREDPEVEIAPQQICHAVDSYLKGISSRGALNHDVFQQIVEAVPEKYRTNQDTFFHVLEKLLQSETDDLSEAERASLLDSVDYSRLSEDALQAALASQLVPVHHIANAALRLCSQLRGELTAAKAIVDRQEQELFQSRGTYGTGGRSRWTTTESTGRRRTSDGTDGTGWSTSKVDSGRDSFSSTLYRPGAASTTRSRSYVTGTGAATTGSHLSGLGYRNATNPGNPYIPTLATELELRLALSSLGDTQLDELRYGSSSLTNPLITSTGIHDYSAFDDLDSDFNYFLSIPSTHSYSRRYYSKH